MTTGSSTAAELLTLIRTFLALAPAETAVLTGAGENQLVAKKTSVSTHKAESCPSLPNWATSVTSKGRPTMAVPRIRPKETPKALTIAPTSNGTEEIFGELFECYVSCKFCDTHQPQWLGHN